MDDNNIKKIKVTKLTGQRKAGIIVNNFYSLITIVIMALVIIWYVNYILPEQEALKQRELIAIEKENIKERNIAKREAQIRLSQKLNKKAKDNNDTK